MEDAFKKKFGEAVRKRRNECGLSKQSLSLMIGINRLTLRRIEAGEANPTLDVLRKLAGGLDISLAKLFLQAEDATYAHEKHDATPSLMQQARLSEATVRRKTAPSQKMLDR